MSECQRHRLIALVGLMAVGALSRLRGKIFASTITFLPLGKNTQRRRLVAPVGLMASGAMSRLH